MLDTDPIRIIFTKQHRYTEKLLDKIYPLTYTCWCRRSSETSSAAKDLHHSRTPSNLSSSMYLSNADSISLGVAIGSMTDLQLGTLPWSPAGGCCEASRRLQPVSNTSGSTRPTSRDLFTLPCLCRRMIPLASVSHAPVRQENRMHCALSMLCNDIPFPRHSSRTSPTDSYWYRRLCHQGPDHEDLFICHRTDRHTIDETRTQRWTFTTLRWTCMPCLRSPLRIFFRSHTTHRSMGFWCSETIHPGSTVGRYPISFNTFYVTSHIQPTGTGTHHFSNVCMHVVQAGFLLP